MLIPAEIFLKHQVPFASGSTFLFGVLTIATMMYSVKDFAKLRLSEPMEIRTVMIAKPPPPIRKEDVESTTDEATQEPEITPEKIQLNNRPTVSLMNRNRQFRRLTLEAGGGSDGSRRSLEINPSSNLSSSTGGNKLLSGEITLSSGTTGDRGRAKNGGGLRGTVGQLGVGSGTDTGLGPGTGPGSSLGGPNGRGLTDSGTSRELQLMEIPEEQYERGVNIAGVCDWMHDNPAQLDPGVIQKMTGDRVWSNRLVGMKTRFKISGRGIIELQSMCDLSINEIHIVLIEGKSAGYIAVRTIGEQGNKFQIGTAQRRTDDSPVIALTLRTVTAASRESRELETLFYLWWNSVSQ